MAKALTKIVEVVIKAIDQTGGAVKGVTGNLNRVSKQSDKTAKSQDKLKKSTDKSTDSMKKQGSSTKKAGTALDKYGKKTDKAKKSSKKLGDALKRTSNEFKKTGSAASGAGSGVGGLITKLTTAVATIGAVAFPIAKAATFERAMATVGAVSGATGDDLANLTDKAREMGEKTEFSATQAAEGLKYLAMAGLNVEQQLAALEPALNLALAGNLDLGRAADIATNIMTGFGATVKELPGMMDVLTQAFTSSNTTLEELGYGMAYVAPVAAGLGVKFNDLVSGMSALANAGIKGSMAGTSLRGMLVKLFSPSTKAVKIMHSLAERIGQTNIELRNSEGGFIGFVGLLEQFEAANISATDAMTIFGLRAGPAFIAMLNQGSTEMKRFNKLMDEATGRTAEIARIMGNNLVGAGKQLLSAFQELAINIGSAFLSNLKNVTLSLRDMLIGMNDWVSANKGIVKSIGYLIAAFGLLTVVATAFSAFMLAKGAIFVPFIDAIGAAISSTVALVASIAAVAIVWGEFIYEMIKSGGDFKKAVEEWDLAKWLNDLVLPFTASKKTIGEFVQVAIAFWDKLISKLGYGFDAIPLGIKGALADAFTLFADFAQGVVDTITAIPGLGKLLGWAADSTGIQKAIDNIRNKAIQMNQEVIAGYAKADQAYKSNVYHANQVHVAIEKTAEARRREADLSDYIAQREAVVSKIRAAAQKEIREATKDLREEIEKQSKVLRTLYEQVGKADEQYRMFVDQAKTALKGLGEATKKALAGVWENVTNDKAVADLKAQLQVMGREYQRYSDQNVATARESARALSKAQIAAVKNGVEQSIVLLESQNKRQIDLIEEQRKKEVGVAKATIKDVEVLRRRLAQIEKKTASEIISINEKTLTQKKALYEKATAALKSELDKSLSAEKSIANEIISIQDKIRQSKMSTEELVRDLRRKGMSEEKAYADEVAEVDEKIAAATALMATDAKKAIQLLQDAQRQASGLVGEIAKGDQILISEQATVNQAIAQVQKAQSAIEAGAKSYETSLKSQLASQQANTNGIVNQLNTVQGKLGETRDQMKEGIEITINVNVGDFENRLTDITKQRSVVVRLETKFAEGKEKLKTLQKELVAATEDIKIKYDVKIADALRDLDEVEKKKLGITEVSDVIEIDADGNAAIVALEVVYASGERVKRLLETPMPVSTDTADAIEQLTEFEKTIKPILDEMSRQEELGFDVSEARLAVKTFDGDITGLKIKLDELGVISLTPLTQEFSEATMSAQELAERIDYLVDAAGEEIVVDIVSAGDDELQAIAQKVKQIQEDTGKELTLRFADVEGYEQIKEVQERAEKLREAIDGLEDQKPEVEIEGSEELGQVAEDASVAAKGINDLAEASGEIEDVEMVVTTEGIDTAQQEVIDLVASVDDADPTLKVETDTSSVDEAKEKIDELDDIETSSAHGVIPDAAKVLAIISKIQKPTSSTHTIYVKKVTKSAIGGFVEGIEGYAKGGPIGMAFKRLSRPYIPGDGIKDDVPAMLMRGEYVIQKDAVKNVGVGFLEQINRMKANVVPGFAKGGLAGMSAPLTLMPTVASGAMSRLKRKLLMKEAPTEVIFREGAPAFTSLVNKKLQNVVTPTGKNIAQGMVNKFSSGVQKLQTGGFLSRSRALYEQERQAITRQYEAQIELAKATGDEQTAFLLQSEQEELQRLADELAATIAQLQYEYEIALREAETTFNEEKMEIEDTLGDLSLEIDKQKFTLNRDHSEDSNDLTAQITKLKAQIKANEKKQKPYTFYFPGHGHRTLRRTRPQQEAFDAIPRDEAEVQKLEKEIRTNQRNYDTEIEFLTRKLDEANTRGERDTASISKKKGFEEEDALHEHTYESGKAEKTVGHEQKKLQIETKHEVAVTKLDTDKHILELEGDLRKELLAIERAMLEEEKAEAERRAAERASGGLKHFLAAGGPAMPRKRKLIPGDGNKDEVPAMLMKGEYVVQKNAVKKFGVGFFDMLNAGMFNMERFATGGLAGFKRKMELMINPAAPYRNKDGVVMNVNNPTFVEHVKNAVTAMTPIGQKHSVNMLSSFRRGTVSLQEGGSISQAEKDLVQEKTLITAEYDAKIKQAKDMGAAEIAALLEEERYELEQLAADLEFTLQQLQDEYEYLKAQITLQQEEEKAAAQAEFDAIVNELRAQRMQAESAYEMAKAEALQMKMQAHADHFTAMRMPTKIPRLSGWAAYAAALSGTLPSAQEYFEKDLALRTKKKDAFDAAAQLRLQATAQDRNADTDYRSSLSKVDAEQRTADTQRKGNFSRVDKFAVAAHRKATADVERETSSAEKKNEIEVKGVQGNTVAEVAKIKAELDGEIAKLQAQLARELFELEKSYRSERASMSGVKHFLKEGGPIGFPAGAQRGIDSIRAMLTPGEYVMNTDAVRVFGTKFMDAINKLKMPVMKFAEGGLVPGISGVQSLATPDAVKNIDPEFAAKIILNLGGKEFAMRSRTDVGRDLVKEFRTLGLAVAR